MPRKKTRKQPPLRKPPRLVDPPRKRKTAAERERESDEITLIQAESHAQMVRESVGPEALAAAALYGKGFVNVPDDRPGPTPKQLAAGGRTAYESFVREAGYAKHASVDPYDKLKTFIVKRWERVALDVFKAMEKAK